MDTLEPTLVITPLATAEQAVHLALSAVLADPMSYDGVAATLVEYVTGRSAAAL